MTPQPCPFCGGEAASSGTLRYHDKHEAWFADGTRITKAFFCNCLKCGVTNQGLCGHQTREKAIEAWNTRAALASQAQPVPEAIESLVSALAESRGWMRDYSRSIIEDAIEREQPAVSAPPQEPVAYQRLVDGKWVECSYFVAYGWSDTISPNCRALYAHPAVEAASASLPAPLPDEEWLKDAERLADKAIHGYAAWLAEFIAGDLPSLHVDRLNAEKDQARRAPLAHLRARHSADNASPVSNEKESDTALLKESMEALYYIARRLEMDIDDGSRPDQWSMEELTRKAFATIAKLRERLS